MKAVIYLISSILCFAGGLSAALKEKAGQSNHAWQDYAWLESDSCAVLLNGMKTIWQFNYDKAHGKPYFYPLSTIDGQNLAWLRPKDHPWHYGLWFSWKFINNSNFWEEDINTRKSQGTPAITGISKTLSGDFSATFKIDLSYTPEAGREALREKRTIRVSAPDSLGNYFIDWSLYYLAKSDTVILDRTLPGKLGGPTYGGYAGLSFRASKNLTRHQYIDANGWVNKANYIGHGEKANWMDLSGTIGNSNGRPGVAMFNHPENGSGQVPWYVYKKGDFAFLNAGILFDEPMVILPGNTLNLKYRVLVHSREMTGGEINAYYKKYIDLQDTGD
ncbi:PmoA family protein [Fulvivirgaceae bacterium BMA12]|uniref:PmoA family protein n=1 Tax=Agaribacillus aureus TaxID=3051825 RepID=A0ABT8LAB7_9BACT|nr:PmoA family protein [Fulvivirgaceae bacterium BMA12]